MPQSNWRVELYEDHNGRRPVEDFFDDLSDEEMARMGRQVGRLERWGPELRRPDADYLRDKIHELRARWRKVQLRVLYFRDGRSFILTHGFKKKSGAVPDSEIKRAVDCRRDYFARKGER
jgi:phage-related protein